MGGVESVVDLGTGTGRAALALAKDGYDVTLVDIADNCLDPDVAEIAPPVVLACLWDDDLQLRVGRHDFAVCVDVLEHIPPEKVDAVLDNIFAVSDHGYLGIACFQDTGGRLVGEPLHLTVESPEWWRKKIGDRAQVRKEGEYAIARY